MQSKLQTISGIFATLAAENAPGYPVYHYQAPAETKAPYIVWAEDDRIDLKAGNIHAEKAWQGTLDFFTHTEFDSGFGYIEALFDAKGFSWRFESVQFEEDTDLIHYEWVWSYA